MGVDMPYSSINLRSCNALTDKGSADLRRRHIVLGFSRFPQIYSSHAWKTYIYYNPNFLHERDKKFINKARLLQATSYADDKLLDINYVSTVLVKKVNFTLTPYSL